MVEQALIVEVKLRYLKKILVFQKTFCIIKKKSCTDIEGMNKLRI